MDFQAYVLDKHYQKISSAYFSKVFSHLLPLVVSFHYIFWVTWLWYKYFFLFPLGRHGRMPRWLQKFILLNITQQLDYWGVLKELIQQQGWPFEDRRALSAAVFFYYFAMISIFACFVYTSQANHSQISTWILLQNSTYLGYHTYLAVLLNLNCAPFRCKSGRADSTVSTRVSWLAKPRSTWFSSVIH